MAEVRSDSRAFEALADVYRRQLLLGLLDVDSHGDADIDPLDILAEGEATDDRAAIRLELMHMHLPKLANMGFIEWNRESDVISRGPNWQEVAPLLRLVDERRDELPERWLSGLPDSA